MTDSSAPVVEQAHVVIKEKSTPWLIWLLPAIALIIGLWLVYKSYRDAGAEVIIYFPLSSNIKPNETELKYEGVRLGVVTKTMLSQDLRSVLAVVEVEKRGLVLLQEDTVFWLVEPKVTASRISGLDTLVSGKYITFQIGEKTSQLGLEEIKKLKPARFEYRALNEPPSRPTYLGGLQLEITSKEPAAIVAGSPVTFKKMQVGEVDKVSLSEDGKSIRYSIFIEDKYKSLINSKTRFWDASGITLKGSLSNVEVRMDSLTSMLIGGIAFGNANDEAESQPVENFHQFVLFKDSDEAFTQKTMISIRFANGEGLSEGMPVKYNGLQVGEVEAIRLDNNLKGVTVMANIYENATAIARSESKFWVVKPELGLASTRNLDTLVGGKYITVEPGHGSPAYRFSGLEGPPVVQNIVASGDLKLILLADQLGSVKQGTNIYYRNVVVGHVDGSELAEDASKVQIYATLEKRYAPLVRQHSKFWNASGIDVGFKLFGGLKMKTESVESLLEGGIAFATPDNADMGDAVTSGTSFSLHPKMEEGWDKWSPAISLNP